MQDEIATYMCLRLLVIKKVCLLTYLPKVLQPCACFALTRTLPLLPILPWSSLVEGDEQPDWPNSQTCMQ